MEYAAWISDGIIDFYFGQNSDQSSTLIKGKKTGHEWAVDYETSYKAQSIDFDRWFRENTSADDLISLKMDIEGSEYKVLQRLIDSGSVSRIKDMKVEWHWDRYPGHVSREEHDRIRNKLLTLIRVMDWA